MAMQAFALPVPWRDTNQEGLHGVVEICASDFRKGELEGLRVRDVLAILNQKIQEDSPKREVSRLMLHGVRVTTNTPVKLLIPELVGSSPRLVATTETRLSRMKGTSMSVFVKTTTGKTVAVHCSSTDTVRYVMTKIEDKDGIPVEDQRLMFAGKQLQGHLTLAFYNVENMSTLHLSLRMLGGFTHGVPAARTFADVSDGSLLTEVNFDPRAPEWRQCCKGLNIEGRCENRDCRAYRQMIIDCKDFQMFNLLLDVNVRCPICRCNVKPVTCGLYDCCWRYEGVKTSDELSISSRWKAAIGYVYHRFNADETSGSTEWSSLLIVVKPRSESVSARLLQSTESVAARNNETCTICWSRLGSLSKTTTTLCGHNFHRVCSNKWTKWCKHHNTQPSCPICRRVT